MLPWLYPPVAPSGARVVKQPWPAPKPTDAVRHGPLRSPLLASRVCTHALTQVHRECVGEADAADQPGDHRLGRQVDYGRPDRPMMLPIPVRLFDRHPPGIRPDRLRHRRCGGEQPPSLRLAPHRRTGRWRLPVLLRLPMLGVAPGSRCPFAQRAGVLLMLRRGGDGGAHDDPARHERLVGAPAAHRRRSTALHAEAARLEMVHDQRVPWPTVTQSLNRRRTRQSVPPWRNGANSAARGKPRSAPRGQRTPGGKARWRWWMSANGVLRKRPCGQGYGMTAQPLGSVRPATTMPASQTSHGPRRVVSSATTTEVPGGKTVSAV